MTADRVKLLDAVAKAAFDYRHLITTETHRELVRAVDALAAHDAQPAAVVGETVEVRGCVGQDGRSFYAFGEAGGENHDLAEHIRGAGYEPRGFFTLSLPMEPPSIPTIAALQSVAAHDRSRSPEIRAAMADHEREIAAEQERRDRQTARGPA